VETSRLAASFEPLNSSLLLSTPKLRMRKATCNPVDLARKSLKPAGCQSVTGFPPKGRRSSIQKPSRPTQHTLLNLTLAISIKIFYYTQTTHFRNS